MITTFFNFSYHRANAERQYEEQAALAQMSATAGRIDWKLQVPSVSSFSKRLIDIVGAIVGLFILLVLLLPIGFAIQIDNPGSVFFRQIRCGYRGKPFYIWKFRSMVCDADMKKHTVSNEAQGPIFKNKSDPRITRVGRFLRRTSLDELPQFLNVLRDEMSLVGPRPPIVAEVTQYEEHHWQRLNAKPGITGHWQTNGRSSITNFEKIVDMDIEYQTNWSVLCDIKIILKTIAILFSSKDAF